jgi:hypothetical protein
MRLTRRRTRALALAALTAALLGLVTPAHAGIVPPTCPGCHPQPRQIQHHSRIAAMSALPPRLCCVVGARHAKTSTAR